MWIPPESADPVLLHHPTRRSSGYFGAVRLRDGKLAGFRTLAIDLDRQRKLSAGLGVDLNKLSSTAHRLLINEVPEIGS
jgi:hypothetical protein